MTRNVRIVVPRGGAANEHRDRLWAFCRAYWEREMPDAAIVEGLWREDEGKYNRSAAINRGAHGNWEVAVVLDADVVLDARLVAEGVERAAETGKLVLPFVHRYGLNGRATDEVLAGRLKVPIKGTPSRQLIGERQTYNVSTCLCVPRRLWDDVGGFDERFEGWGGEDDAFYSACDALAGADRMQGVAWHLWHPYSAMRDWKAPHYTQAKALAERYVHTAKRQRAAGMRALLDENRGSDQVVVVCLTNGKRDTLERTIASADAMLRGPIGRRLIIGDKCAPSFDGWDTEQVDGGRYWRAMRHAQRVALGSGQPWIFWLEDDFLLDEPVDLAAMQAIMVNEPWLAQLTLMRQPWYPHEKEAGSVQASVAHRSPFVQRDGWVEHAAYWTQNPMLIRRDTFAQEVWPKVPDSEQVYGRAMFERGMHAGILGGIDDAPRCTHIGEERASGLGH